MIPAGLHWWQIFFMILGIIAFLTGFANLFLSSLGRHSIKFFVRNLISVQDFSFLATLARLMNTSITHGGNISILNNGDEFIPALSKDIISAQKSINFTVYIWKDGQMSDQIFKMLIEKARSGVKVRLLLDGFGGIGAPNGKIEELREAGGMVAYFRSVRLGRFTRIHKRSHARAIIIDDTVGYVGGMAVADYWLGNAETKNSWRDMMFRLTGNLVRHPKSAFSTLWAASTGEILLDNMDYPNPLPEEKHRYSLNLVSSPSEDTEPLPGFFWFSIAAAKKSVYITTPYFTPKKFIRKTLISLARKGVDVQIILPGNCTDTKIVRYASHFYYERLLKEGIKIFEYQPTMIHSKMLVVDSVWSIVGSANMDSRSAFLNEENIVGIHDESFASSLEKTFAEDLKNCTEIRYKEWRHRNIIKRISEYTCSLIDHQF